MAELTVAATLADRGLDVQFTIAAGEVLAVLGANGAGKSTTAGVITWRGGEIDVCNMQANTSSATASQLLSPPPSANAPDSSDDEELGAWIYKNWHRLE